MNGNSVKVFFGKETSYGTAVTPTNRIQISNESLKPIYAKENEGLLTGNKGASKSYTMGIKTEGSISTLARPNDIGLFLACLLGNEADVEASEDAYEHTFTPIGTAETDVIPSLTAIIDRGVDAFTYNGLAVNSMTLSADAGGFVNMEVSLTGKDETGSASVPTSTPSTQKAFKFNQGKVYLKEAGETEAVELADVTSISWEYNNNLDVDTQTTSTGLYYKEPEAGTREITSNISCIYTSNAEEYRNKYYKSDDELGLVLRFVSDETTDQGVPMELEITIPCNQVTDSDANVGGAERLTENLVLTAADNGSDELCTVKLINTVQNKY